MPINNAVKVNTQSKNNYRTCSFDSCHLLYKPLNRNGVGDRGHPRSVPEPVVS